MSSFLSLIPNIANGLASILKSGSGDSGKGIDLASMADKAGLVGEQAKNLNIFAKTFDINGDGKLDNEEAAKMNNSVSIFMENGGLGNVAKLAGMCDTNGDGNIDNAEMQLFAQFMNGFGDGKGNITAEGVNAFNDFVNAMKDQADVYKNQGFDVNLYGAMNQMRAGAGNSRVYSKPSKPEPTLDQKIDTSDKDVKEIEKQIQDVKTQTAQKVDEAEKDYKAKETELTQAKENDSAAVKKAKEDISAKSKEIDEKEKAIEAKGKEIDGLKSSISTDKASLANKKNELAGLSVSTGNPAADAKNAARKTVLEGEIKALEAKIQKEEAELQKAEAEKQKMETVELPKLQTEKTNLENDLAKADASYAEQVKALQAAKVEVDKNVVVIKADGDKSLQELEKQLEAKRAERTSLNEKQGTSRGKAGQVGSAIDSIMKKGGALDGKGDLIAQVADEYGIPADDFAAIIALETGGGTSNALRTKNNPGGLMCGPNAMQLQQFDSLEDGLRKMASNLKRNYYNQGRDTLAKIQPKYCPVGAANDPNGTNGYWLTGTTKYKNKINSEMS